MQVVVVTCVWRGLYTFQVPFVTFGDYGVAPAIGQGDQWVWWLSFRDADRERKTKQILHDLQMQQFEAKMERIKKK